MEYKKVKSILEYFYKELEKQAEKDGIDTDSFEYKQVKLELKRRILLRLEIDLNEFEDIENAQTDKASKLSKEEKKELVKEVVKEEVMPKEDIKKLIKEYKPVPQIINKIVREKIIEKPIITNTTKVIRETIKELDTTELNKIGSDLFKLQSDFISLYDKVNQIKIPDYSQITEVLKKDSADHITRAIDVIGMPDFRKLAMGLRGDIDEVRGLVNTENLFDRTGTTIGTHTAGDNLLLTGTLGAGAITGTGLKILEAGATPTLYGIFSVPDLTTTNKTYTFPTVSGSVAYSVLGTYAPIDNYIDQAVKTISSPSFSTLTLGLGSNAGVLTLLTGSIRAEINSGGDLYICPAGALDLISTAGELRLVANDELGQVSLYLQNRAGSNGALFANASLDVVDFGFKPSENVQSNIRLEGRSAYFFDASNTTGEFQYFMDATNPEYEYVVCMVMGAGAVVTLVPLQVTGGIKSSDGSAGITGTLTTASLVGKTLTFKNGLITGFA